MKEQKVYLLANAHLDPAWLWEREEGIAEALSTFRVAAGFCEQEAHFVFNHNEALLYQWVEEYEPELFARIENLVARGKWHIMGGWYLQPDCNMPSGESFVRQIRQGRRYFWEKFRKRPTTAINFDPFGHTRGLVQILVRAGYDSYLFMRPGEGDLELPDSDFWWQGLDGSAVLAHRLYGGYNTLKGQAADKLAGMMERFTDREELLVLWGVGDHGGGPSAIDLQRLNRRMEEEPDGRICHGVPEAYFARIRRSGRKLPTFDKSLQSWAPGCYSSQIRVKQLHRRLENELFLTEKMASAAWLQQGMEYPAAQLEACERDLLFAQFHDILPGSSIQDVEEAGIRILNHGLEELSRIRTKAFFRLCSGQPQGMPGTIPILVYNPHPYVVEQPIYCEFQLEDQNWEDSFTLPVVKRQGRIVPSQPVKERCNLNLDWRKRVVFQAPLQPFSMNRFDCELIKIAEKPSISIRQKDGLYRIETRQLAVAINGKTGMLERYEREGCSLLASACRLEIYRDSEDPWAMRQSSFLEPCGVFVPMEAEEAARFAGIEEGLLSAVHVVEDGEVETVVEALLAYGASRAVVQYHIPKSGAILQVSFRVYWNEGKKMLKWVIPTGIRGEYMGQTAFGAERLFQDGRECVSGKWSGLFDDGGQDMLAFINNGTYASSCQEGTVSLTMLRSPCYSAHPILDREILPQDRFSPRIDQGERCFDYWLFGGSCEEVRDLVDSYALSRNEQPQALTFFPPGAGVQKGSLLTVSDPAIVLSACEVRAEGLCLRCYNSTDLEREAEISVPERGFRQTLRFGRYEVRSLWIGTGGEWREAELADSAL